MDRNFEACLLFTLKQEGGFSNDPHDPGGPTYKGITLAEYRIFRGDPNLTVVDLLNMSATELTTIYRKHYWIPCLCFNEMPDGIDCSVFDMGVNAGVLTSLKVLQRALGVVDDGIIGPKSRAALNAADSEHLLMVLEVDQKAYYRGLTNFIYFGNGWLSRAYARYNQGMALLPPAKTRGRAISN